MFRNRRQHTAATPRATSRQRPFAERALIVLLGASAPLAATTAAFGPSANAATTPNIRIALSTHKLTFGTQNAGSSKTLSVDVRNTGKKSVSPVAGLAGSSTFSISANTCSGHSLAPGKRCSYSVTFAPAAAGAAHGTLQVRPLPRSSAQKVALSGAGVVQQEQAYTYRYTYKNPPVVNGLATPQWYDGVGFAPAGTYASGQTIQVYDATGQTQVGSYTIGRVAEGPLGDEVNTVGVATYHWGSYAYYTSPDLRPITGASGLGSEGGTVLGHACNNQHAGIVQSHF